MMAELVQHRFTVYLLSFDMVARLAFAGRRLAYGAVLCLIMQDIEYAQIACGFLARRLFFRWEVLSKHPIFKLKVFGTQRIAQVVGWGRPTNKNQLPSDFVIPTYY